MVHLTLGLRGEFCASLRKNIAIYRKKFGLAGSLYEDLVRIGAIGASGARALTDASLTPKAAVFSLFSR